MKAKKSQSIAVIIFIILLFLLCRTVKAENIKSDIIYELKTGQVLWMGPVTVMSESARIQFNKGKNRIVTLTLDKTIVEGGSFVTERVIQPPFAITYVYYVDSVTAPTKIIQRLADK